MFELSLFYLCCSSMSAIDLFICKIFWNHNHMKIFKNVAVCLMISVKFRTDFPLSLRHNNFCTSFNCNFDDKDEDKAIPFREQTSLKTIRLQARARRFFFQKAIFVIKRQFLNAKDDFWMQKAILECKRWF